MNEIVNWIKEDLPAMLLEIPVQQVLANGKMEREIKCLLAVAWEKQKPGRRICLLDKDFNGGQLDLLALERRGDDRNTAAGPTLWIEVKCSFWQDGKDARKCAKAAREQVKTAYKQITKSANSWKESKKIAKPLPKLCKRTDERSISRRELIKRQLQEIATFRAALMNSDGYIVHIINSCPANENGLLPNFVASKFPRPKRKLTRNTLIDRIRDIYRDSPHYAQSRAIAIWSPNVSALVVKLKRK